MEGAPLGSSLLCAIALGCAGLALASIPDPDPATCEATIAKARADAQRVTAQLDQLQRELADLDRRIDQALKSLPDCRILYTRRELEALREQHADVHRRPVRITGECLSGPLSCVEPR